MNTPLDIKGYEGLYQVDRSGKVISLDRYNIDKNGKRKFYPSITLKYDVSVKNKTSYARVTLSKDGKVKKFFVHRLVAICFLPNPKNKPYINHIDNNGMNNSVENLEWVTHSENMIHSQRQGRLFDSQSKGGKVGGKMNHSKMLCDAKNMEGKEYGLYKVISYSKPHSSLKNIPYMNCICLGCDKEYLVRKTSLTTGVSKRCRACGLKHKSKLHKEQTG